METHPNCKTRRRNSRGPVCSSFVSAQSDTHDASNSNANSAAGIISAKSVLHKVFEPNVLLAHKSAIRHFPLVRGPTDLKKVLKVSATNGVVKILSARDLVYWRTRDYYKLGCATGFVMWRRVVRPPFGYRRSDAGRCGFWLVLSKRSTAGRYR